MLRRRSSSTRRQVFWTQKLQGNFYGVTSAFAFFLWWTCEDVSNFLFFWSNGTLYHGQFDRILSALVYPYSFLLTAKMSMDLNMWNWSVQNPSNSPKSTDFRLVPSRTCSSHLYYCQYPFIFSPFLSKVQHSTEVSKKGSTFSRHYLHLVVISSSSFQYLCFPVSPPPPPLVLLL